MRLQTHQMSSHPDDHHSHFKISNDLTRTDVCRVGYALNPKKMRKSGAEKQTNVKPKWQGGGLADILFGMDGDDSIVDGVAFVPWDSNMSTAEQVKIEKRVANSHYHFVGLAASLRLDHSQIDRRHRPERAHSKAYCVRELFEEISKHSDS